MMQVKLLEVRDVGTFIPVMCVDMNPNMRYDSGHSDRTAEPDEGQRYLLRRCGYPCDGRPNVALTRLDAGGGKCWSDPYGWADGARTMRVAHAWIIEHWDELRDGDVVCVEHILGERADPKVSERLTAPL